MNSFPDLELVCCSMSSFNCCFLTCIQISQETGQVVWYSHLFKNFWASLSSVGKEATCIAGDTGSISGSGRFPGEGLDYPLQYSWAFLGSAGKEAVCNAGDLGSIPGLGRSPGKRKGNPFQYSGLENSVDCIVHWVTKSRRSQ